LSAVIDRRAGHNIVSDIYTSEINVLRGTQQSTGNGRLPPAAAALAVFALSVLFWAPVLLPVLIFTRG